MPPLLVHGAWSIRYDLGSGHPLTPRRFGPGIDLLNSISEAAPTLLAPAPATDDVLRWAHTPAYIQAVRRLSNRPFGPGEAGIGPGDTPAFAGMHEASAAVVGGSVDGMEAILRGDVLHVFHPGGGLHHAMAGRAAGFCVYNDPALAIARARRDGMRVLYIDLDVHHGDGVQAIHWHDPGVLTVSIHQSGLTLFPGTGFVDEVGEGEAAGTAVNVPLEHGTGEGPWLAILEGLLPELASAFGPDVVVSQHGADAHAWDPLANLRVTTTAMGAAARLVDAIAHRWAGGRWLATGGGGYDVYRVVPRVWSLVWLAATHDERDRRVPDPWRARWATDAMSYGQSPLPTSLEDEPNAGLPIDAAQRSAERAAAGVASLVRELTVPALIRLATDLGWWRALDVPGGSEADFGLARTRNPTGMTTASIAKDTEPAAPTLIDVVTATDWEGLVLAPGVLSPMDPPSSHALVLAALSSVHGARVSAAIFAGTVVGAVVSAVQGGKTDATRRLVAVGVAREHRGRGLATELIRRHLAALPATTAWMASVSLAERDPLVPLPRTTRAGVARRLLEGAGFRVEPAGGELGRADPLALVARR